MAKMKDTEEKFKVTGMHCSGCANSVSNVLNNIDGVHSADVSLEQEQAVVTFDGSKTNFSQMEEAVENAGYQMEKL